MNNFHALAARNNAAHVLTERVAAFLHCAPHGRGVLDRAGPIAAELLPHPVSVAHARIVDIWSTSCIHSHRGTTFEYIRQARGGAISICDILESVSDTATHLLAIVGGVWCFPPEIA
jgi:hypothetical protein